MVDEFGMPRYVGRTVARPQTRLASHLWEARSLSKTYKSRWILSMLGRGLSPKIIVIQVVVGLAHIEECIWIAAFKNAGARLTNLTIGGEGSVGNIQSDESRRKKSLALRGMVRSLESRMRMSAARKGIPISQAHRDKISLANSGKKRTEAQRKIISLRLTGRLVSNKTRLKLSLAKIGKHLSRATRNKISRAKTGVKLTPRHKLNIKIGMNN